MNTKLWTCADGRKIRVKDMGDAHLLNTIALLERTHARRQMEYAMLPAPQVEMAEMAFEQECSALAESEPGDSFPIYDDMVTEADRRGILNPNNRDDQRRGE